MAVILKFGQRAYRWRYRPPLIAAEGEACRGGEWGKGHLRRGEPIPTKVNCELTKVNCELTKVNCELTKVNCELTKVNCELAR